MSACSLFIVAFQHTIHCIHNSYFSNNGCQSSTKTVTMEKSIIMQNSVPCNQSIWLNGKTAVLHYAKISPTVRNLHITISILTHICSYFMTHMKRSISGLNKVVIGSVQSLIFASNRFVINILVLTTLAAVDKTCVHAVMLFLTLTLTDYHVGLSSLGHQGWRWSVTTSKLSDSKISISSKQATSNAHSSIRN